MNAALFKNEKIADQALFFPPQLQLLLQETGYVLITGVPSGRSAGWRFSVYQEAVAALKSLQATNKTKRMERIKRFKDSFCR